MTGPRAELRTLEELRAHLARIDHTLVLTLCAREEVQREILELKRSRSMPLIDLEREREVRRRAQGWARQAGGDPDLAGRVVLEALESGKRRFFDASPDTRVPSAALPALGREKAPAAGGRTRTAVLEPATASLEDDGVPAGRSGP